MSLTITPSLTDRASSGNPEIRLAVNCGTCTVATIHMTMSASAWAALANALGGGAVLYSVVAGNTEICVANDGIMVCDARATAGDRSPRISLPADKALPAIKQAGKLVTEWKTKKMLEAADEWVSAQYTGITPAALPGMTWAATALAVCRCINKREALTIILRVVADCMAGPSARRLIDDVAGMMPAGLRTDLTCYMLNIAVPA